VRAAALAASSAAVSPAMRDRISAPSRRAITASAVWSASVLGQPSARSRSATARHQPPKARAEASRTCVRAGGRFHKINRGFAIRHAERPGADLAAELRTHAASRRLPKVTNYRNIVVDMLVHGQDIAIPLGIRREMPPDAARAGIERVWTMGWPFGVNRPRSLTAVVGRRCRRTVQPGQTVAAPRRTSDRTMAAVANSPENTRFSTVCLRGVCSHFSRRTERPV
jgi:hypothetical protein